MDISFSLSDIVFIILEAAILYYVRLEWIQGKRSNELAQKHFDITQKLSDHQMNKYKRYKGKRIIKQILKEENGG